MWHCAVLPVSSDVINVTPRTLGKVLGVRISAVRPSSIQCVEERRCVPGSTLVFSRHRDRQVAPIFSASCCLLAFREIWKQVNGRNHAGSRSTEMTQHRQGVNWRYTRRYAGWISTQLTSIICIYISMVSS